MYYATEQWHHGMQMCIHTMPYSATWRAITLFLVRFTVSCQFVESTYENLKKMHDI